MRSDPISAPGGATRKPAQWADLHLKKADLHLHSSHSFDVLDLPALSPRALYDKAVKRGMGFFTLTDHDTMRGVEELKRDLAVEYGESPPIPLIAGIEIKVRDPRIGHTVHVNVLGLDQAQMIELARRRRSIDRFTAFCRREGLFHAYNHPFWFERGERGDLSTIEDLIGLFPVIELNAGRIPQLNGRTSRLAQKLGKSVIAASDSHTGRVGRAYSVAPGTTPQEFLGSILAGVCRAVPEHLTPRGLVQEVDETVDLVLARRSPFTPKASFLRTRPLARRIAELVLGSELLMASPGSRRAMKGTMRLMAFAPAYACVLQQRTMHWRLGEMDR
ncbi:MAG: PHP domain-containing protein [Candidatus Eisenbacteria bacterium]|nr:PHP domain-containing protein [Candidatus Eisenbacteria bacterium]